MVETQYFSENPCIIFVNKESDLRFPIDIKIKLEISHWYKK